MLCTVELIYRLRPNKRIQVQAEYSPSQSIMLGNINSEIILHQGAESKHIGWELVEIVDEDEE